MHGESCNLASAGHPYLLQEATGTPQQHMPTAIVHSENKLIEELLKLNPTENWNNMYDTEQQTIKTTTI